MGSYPAVAVAALIFLVSGSYDRALAHEVFPPADEKALVDIIKKGMVAQRQPGLNVGIWIPGRGSLVRAFGTSNIVARTPMQLHDHVRIASITN